MCYDNTVLRRFFKSLYSLLFQDNDSKHKSRSTTAWLQRNGVETMECPPSSPDLNPIENVWAALKLHLRNKIKPRTKEQLVDGIVKFWTTLSSDDCAKYIDHVHKVLPVVVANDGGPTIY